MVNLKNLSLAPLGAVFIALLTTSAGQAAELFGNSQPFGNGSIRSFITLDDTSGKPLDVGISFPKADLSLPVGSGNQYNTNEYITTELSLPPQASTTPYTQIEVNYAPNGYPPGGPVTSPLFDIYFFQINPQERDLICPHPDTTSVLPDCVGEERALARKTPEPGTLPEGVIPLLDGSPLKARPRYGTRYYDGDLAIAANQNPQSLTSFYGYGFYDGKPDFTNFVISESFLEKQPNDVTTPLKVPTSYLKNGYYPTEYNVRYDATSQEYRLSLSGLTFRSSTSIPELSPTLGLLVLGLWGTFSLGKNKLKKQKLASR